MIQKSKSCNLNELEIEVDRLGYGGNCNDISLNDLDIEVGHLDYRTSNEITFNDLKIEVT